MVELPPGAALPHMCSVVVVRGGVYLPPQSPSDVCTEAPHRHVTIPEHQQLVDRLSPCSPSSPPSTSTHPFTRQHAPAPSFVYASKKFELPDTPCRNNDLLFHRAKRSKDACNIRCTPRHGGSAPIQCAYAILHSMVVAACHCVGILQYRDIAYATAASRERLFRDLVQDTQHSAPAILPWVWDTPQNAAAGPDGMGAHPVEQQRIEVRPALLLPLCIH